MDKFLVKTDHGDVLVEINRECSNALEPNLLKLSQPTADNSRDITMEVPLRAFGAKMLDIIEIIGTGEFQASATMLEMMKREKASSDLNRIERWARNQAKQA